MCARHIRCCICSIDSHCTQEKRTADAAAVVLAGTGAVHPVQHCQRPGVVVAHHRDRARPGIICPTDKQRECRRGRGSAGCGVVGETRPRESRGNLVPAVGHELIHTEPVPGEEVRLSLLHGFRVPPIRYLFQAGGVPFDLRRELVKQLLALLRPELLPASRLSRRW